MKIAIVLNLLTLAFLCTGAMVAVTNATPETPVEEAYDVLDGEILDASEEFNICPEVLEAMIETGDISDIESTCEELKEIQSKSHTDDMFYVLAVYYNNFDTAQEIMDRSFELEELHGMHDYSEYLNSQIQ